MGKRYAGLCVCVVLNLAAFTTVQGCGDVRDLSYFIDDTPLIDLIDAQHQEKSNALHQALRANCALRYPVLLVHGMAGFRPIARLLDYFYGVRVAMAAQGYRVYASQTDPFQAVAYRGRQLAIQVDEVLRLTGAPRVHLIAHSQGGLDARYMISSLRYGDRVASLVTVATPHHGVQLVDMALRLRPSWVGGLAKVVNALSDGILGGHADLLAQLHDLSTVYAEGAFNPQNPDDPRVAYYSYAGSTQANPFVNRSFTDVVNPFLLGTYRLIARSEGDNDGVVPSSSARWGTHMGIFPADHWDEIGQPPSVFQKAFDHIGFYCAVARFLDSSGPPPLY